MRRKYQNGGGSSTLISKAKGEKHGIPERRPVYSKTPMTAEEYERYLKGEKISKLTPDEYQRYLNGEIIYRDTNRTYPEIKKITDPKKMTPEELEVYNSGKDVYRKTGKIKDATITMTNMGMRLTQESSLQVARSKKSMQNTPIR